MSNYTSRNLLEAWENAWGKLPDKWKTEFLTHPAIPELLMYPDNWIEIAILRNQKLNEALTYLKRNEKELEPQEYRPEILESDEMINKLTRSLGKQASSPIPENDWWRDQD
jgi:hypothetical protein